MTRKPRPKCPKCKYRLGMNNLCFRCDERTYATEPTPEDIQARCEEIRARWSPEEEQRRTAPAYRTKPVELDSNEKLLPD